MSNHNEVNTTYNEAREKAAAASIVFAKVRKDYLNGTIDTASFLAAQKTMAAAEAEFDIAFAVAQEVSRG